MADDPKALKDQRIHVLMTEEEVQAVDDWSFNHRIKSRGEAMRRLCQIGIALDARLPHLMKKYVEAINAYADAREAVRAVRNAKKLDAVALAAAMAVQDAAAFDVAQKGLFFFSEMMVVTGPLRRKGAPMAESISLSDGLAELLSTMDPTDSEDNRTMAGFLRALNLPDTEE